MTVPDYAGPDRRKHIRSRLSAGRFRSSSAGRDRGDDDLNPGMKPVRDRLTPAAVLVGLIDRPSGFNVLLTQRTAHLRDHAGQISFPGGKIEELDTDPVSTALREAEEEVGLKPDRVEVVGALDRYVTRTGFDVTPVVGFITPPVTLVLDAFEVDEAFEVPLAHFMAPGATQRHSRIFQGQKRHYYAMPYQGYYIWGATAGMLVNLVEVLTGETETG